MADDNLLLVGKFTAPHGLKGLLKVISYLDDPQSIVDYEELLSKDGQVCYHLTLKGLFKHQLLVAVDGITSKNDAETLRNIGLYIRQDNLPDLEEDEFYIHQLTGMQVHHAQTYELLGTVKAMHNFGAGDIMDITPPDGASYMIAFNAQTVPNVDMDAGIIHCLPPEILSTGSDEKPVAIPEST